MQIEQKTLTSMEVAEMVEKSHNELLKDIRRYSEQLGQGKIPQSDFFTESTYHNSQNKTQPCYLVTKKGCEFIAHKLTGVKGTTFTAKYINKFHEMEEQIKDPRKLSALDQIQLIAQGTVELSQKLGEVSNRVDRLEYDIPLYGSEAEELSNHVKRKGVEVLGGKKNDAYKDTKIRSLAYADIYNVISREFGLFDENGRRKSYKNLKRKNLDQAHEIVEKYEPPLYLKEQIDACNSQISMNL